MRAALIDKLFDEKHPRKLSERRLERPSAPASGHATPRLLGTMDGLYSQKRALQATR